jgi:quinol monooxygenase YgiN
MSIDRRTFVASAGFVAAFAAGAVAAAPRKKAMYGLISKIVAQPDRRDELVKILLEGVGGSLPGCLSYVVATDPADANSIWVTEVWQSRQAHAASLSAPAINEAMIKGRPLIASFVRIAETTPAGGLGVLQK